ncbi:hypothetical protein TNCV_4094551 [Trichonephila clavipes]|nr:hypothetical protein TNCV_4094551 [Trichonephila clavipes]
MTQVSELLKLGNDTFPCKVVPIAGNGSCLFSSISYLLCGNVQSSSVVRQAVVDYIISNWDRFKFASKVDFMPITRAMDEQLNALLEGINALKSGQEDMQKSQEETKERMENMQRSQEETKNELKRREWRNVKKN